LFRHLALIVLAACLCLSGQARADETVNEIWPELDLWLNLPAGFRLSSFIALSQREVTDYREGTFILQADYAWKSSTLPGLRRRLADEAEVAEMKPMMLRWGYLSGESLDDDGAEYSEDSALLEFHLRTPLKSGVLFSSRLRSDLRFLGPDHDFSWRLRYRLMVEKEFLPRGRSLVPYLSAEAFYDSRHDEVSRVRLIGGASVGFGKRYALEGNATFQRDSQSSPEELAALNLILHVRFRQRSDSKIPGATDRTGPDAAPDDQGADP
jgi:hypothetical protein